MKSAAVAFGQDHIILDCVSRRVTYPIVHGSNVGANLGIDKVSSAFFFDFFEVLEIFVLRAGGYVQAVTLPRVTNAISYRVGYKSSDIPW